MRMIPAFPFERQILGPAYVGDFGGAVPRIRAPNSGRRANGLDGIEWFFRLGVRSDCIEKGGGRKSEVKEWGFFLVAGRVICDFETV